MKKRTLPCWRMKKRAAKGSGRSIAFVLISIFGGAPTEIAAQEPLRVEPGERVRVTAPDCALRGQAATFRALRADTLVLDTTECPLASTIRLDVNRGRKSNARLGAAIGFAAGALGVVVFCHGGECVWRDDDVPDYNFTAPFSLLVGAMGGLVGGITGFFIKTDRWEEVPMERLRVSPTPQRPVGNDVGQKSWAGLMTGGYSTGLGGDFGGGSSVGFTAALYRVRSSTFDLGVEAGYDRLGGYTNTYFDIHGPGISQIEKFHWSMLHAAGVARFQPDRSSIRPVGIVGFGAYMVRTRDDIEAFDPNGVAIPMYEFFEIRTKTRPGATVGLGVEVPHVLGRWTVGAEARWHGLFDLFGIGNFATIGVSVRFD